jgi:CheY-like chemotaxis protein
MKKILVAEDDEDILYILDRVLTDAGYAVESLSTGEPIVSKTTGWPDLFILDKDIPVVNGIAVSKFLRSRKETKHIPIIMISAFHYLKEKAEDAGVNEFIQKPFELKKLLAVVHHYVNSEPELNPVES